MIGCLPSRIRKQPIIALYFEFETLLKFYNLEARKVRKILLELGSQNKKQKSEFFSNKIDSFNNILG